MSKSIHEALDQAHRLLKEWECEMDRAKRKLLLAAQKIREAQLIETAEKASREKATMKKAR